MQFNARTTPQTVKALYAIADQQGWLVGETLERALATLRRELAGQGNPSGREGEDWESSVLRVLQNR